MHDHCFPHIDSTVHQPTPWDAEVLTALAFVGNTLSPFFAKDPKLEPEVRQVYDLLIACAQNVEVINDAQSWPFIDHEYLAERNQALAQIAQTNLADESCMEELIWDYRRLFIGPDKLPAPPYGSVYTDVDGVIFGSSCIELRLWMKRQGIVCHIDDNLPEDHIAKMLILLAFMAQTTPELVEEFLSNHLLPWAPHYFTKAAASAHTPFFQGIFMLARLTLEGMITEFGLDVREVTIYR